jgi:hypothetical protein
MSGCVNGIHSIEVLAANGQPSMLYRELEKYYGKDKGLKEYLKVHSSSFKDTFGDWVNDSTNRKLDVNGEPQARYIIPDIKYQLASTEGILASEKTLRDITAKMADKIGYKFTFESDRTLPYKGKVSGNTAFINLAHATLDTPIHELLGHPIIRAIKDNPHQKDLYNNLLKELEYGAGKEILDRIKSTYSPEMIKGLSVDDYRVTELSQMNNPWATERKFIIETLNPDSETSILFNEEFDNKEEAEEYLRKKVGYGAEEHAEEAIVELLGLLTAGKLNELTDKTLIAKLKKLLNAIRQYVKDLIKSKEIHVDNLAEDLTLGELSDILAYSNGKIILPGSEVEYTTPDGVSFKTYTEASAHISKMAEASKNQSVDLSSIDIDKKLSEEDIKKVEMIDAKIGEWQSLLKSQKYLEEKAAKLAEFEEEKNKFVPRKQPFTDESDFYLPWDAPERIANLTYARIRPNTFKSWDGVTKFVPDSDAKFVLHEYNAGTKDSNDTSTPISDELAFELYNKYSDTILSEDRDKLSNMESVIHSIRHDLRPKTKIVELRNKKKKILDNPIQGFIDKNKQYEESKSIIDNWKKDNGIVYNPDEVYSRGQGFYSAVGAYSSFDVDLMFQNILQHIEDNETAGGKFTLSVFTKPVGKKINHLEGNSNINFVIYPEPQDIEWAATADVFSGSVWNAGEVTNAQRKSELSGVSYTKTPSLTSLNSVVPSLAEAVDKRDHHHNELGINLTGKNFRLEYADGIPYSTKRIVDNINKILDQKYGKINNKRALELQEKGKVLSLPTGFRKGAELNVIKSDFDGKYYIEEWSKDVFGNTASELVMKNKDTSELYSFDNINDAYDLIDIVKKGVPQKSPEAIEPVKTVDNTSKLTIPQEFEFEDEDFEIDPSAATMWEGELPDSFTPLDGGLVYREGETWMYEDIHGYVNEIDSEDYVRYAYQAVVPKQEKEKQEESKYHRQAIINKRVDALKKVAKKMPRSLIKSKVINNLAYDLNESDSLTDDIFVFQKMPVMYQLTDSQKQKYKGQEMNDIQSTIVNGLIEQQEGIQLTEDEGHYVKDGTLFERVSNFLFGVKERNAVDPHYKAQGNVYHKVLENIVYGRTWEEALMDVDTSAGVPTIELQGFYDDAKAFIDSKKRDGAVFMTETTLHYNGEALKFAGSADLIAVNADGTLDIYDLKTSKHSTLNADYKSKSWTIDGGYFKDVSLTKQESHAAQQTMYARALENLGYTVNGIHILPYVLTRDNTNRVTSATREPIVDLRINEDLATSVIPTVGPKIKVDPESKITWSNAILDDVRIFLEKRLQRATQTISDQANRQAAERKINQIKSDIAKVDDALKVAKFIEIANNELAGEKGLANSFDRIKKELTEAVENGSITPNEAVRRLDQFRSYAEGYNVLDTILGANRNVNFVTKDGDSTIEKLNRAISAKNHILSEYDATVDEFMDAILSEVASDDINVAAKKNIASIDNQIKVAKNRGASPRHIARLEERKIEYMDSIAERGTIKEALHTIRKDVGLADYWLSPLISSGNKALALFAKHIKKIFEEIRLHLMQFQREAYDEFKKYEASRGATSDVAKFNEGIYEKRTVYKYDEVKGEYYATTNASFVEAIDWNKYNEAAYQMRLSLKGLTGTALRDARDKWYKENKETLSFSEIDEKIADYKPSMDDLGFAKWMNANMYLKDGYSEMKKSVRLGIKTEEQALLDYSNVLLDAHNGRNGALEYKNGLTKPKKSMYYNQAYAKFEPSAPNTPIKQYYNYLVSKYLAAQERLPAYARQGMIIPSVPKTDSDRLIEQGYAGGKKIIKESFNYSAEDDATMEYRSLDGNNKTVPIKYVNKLEFEDVSLDLINSIAMFEESTLKYQQVTKALPEVNAMMSLFSKAKVLKTNSKGRNLVDSTAKKLGIDDKYVEKHGGNLAAAQLESFIDMQIYGAMSERETWGSVDVGKVADTMMAFTSQTTIAWDILKPVSNSLQANLMLALEGIAREHVSRKSLMSAKGDYLLSQGQVMSDMTKPFNQSLLGQMTDLYDAIQGKFKDEFGKTLSWSAAKRASTSKTGFFLMNLGEHEVQTTLMLAMMKDVKLLHNGQQISLDKAYEIGQDGVIKMLDGVTKLDGSEWTEKDRFDLMNKLHAINKRMHGIYNSFDRVHLKRFAAGRLMMLFRNFLVPGIKRRFKSLSGDQELGAHTEGYYTTFFNTFGRDLLSLKFDISQRWSELNDMEKANVKRFIGEMSMIVTFQALTVALTMMAAGTDDDDLAGYMLHYALYQSTRIKSELSAYLNPMDALKILRSPSASTTSIERVMKVLYYIGIDPWDGELDRYKKDTGKFKKGDLKLSAAVQKLFGLHGRNLNPEEAVKLLNFNR